MSLFGRSEKKELELLKQQLTPQQRELYDINDKLAEAKTELAEVHRALEDNIKQLEELKKELIETDEAVLLQSFGIYTPHYAYTTSDEYKARIADIRAEQKELVKSGYAVSGIQDWQVNGDKAKGRKMVKDTQKLLLRAFNVECDDAIEHVKFNNIEAYEKKIISSAEAISKLGTIMNIAISPAYVKLKIDELHLLHEYQVKKQDEKEAMRELRDQQREAARAMKELEEARKKLGKEQSHYQNELNRLIVRLENASESERADLAAKREALEAQLETINAEMQDVDYRTSNQRAGYVYIISNIGAFGEGVYKIGMTRRLDPMERVYELGDASVPFNFDVHAMIFAEDAPGLESALHNAFASRRINFVNQRREFFRVSLDEIKAVVTANYDKTVEFVDIAPAEQYRESLKIADCPL